MFAWAQRRERAAGEARGAYRPVRQAWVRSSARRGVALPLLRERHVGRGPQGLELMQGHRVCALKGWAERLRALSRAAAQPAIVFLAFSALRAFAGPAVVFLMVAVRRAFVVGPRRERWAERGPESLARGWVAVVLRAVQQQEVLPQPGLQARAVRRALPHQDWGSAEPKAVREAAMLRQEPEGRALVASWTELWAALLVVSQVALRAVLRAAWALPEPRQQARPLDQALGKERGQALLSRSWLRGSVL